jgi:hypothetical protein
MAVRSLWILGLSFLGAVYRYHDTSGQEHYVSDPALAPPSSSLEPVDLRQAPVTQVPPGLPVRAAAEGGGAVVVAPQAPSPLTWRSTWMWAALVSLGVFLVFVVAAATVPGRYRQVSWSLSVGRYVAFLLLAATVLAASYELRDDPAMQRYSPWAALQRVRRTRLEVERRDAAQKAALDQAGGSGSPAR